MLQKIVNCFKTSRIWRNSQMQSHAHAEDLASDKGYLGVFPKRKGKILHAYLLSYFLCFGHDSLHFAMLLLTQSAPKTRFLGSTTHSPRFGAKNEIYYSLLLFICHYSLLLFTVTIHLLLFTPNFCLFKGGCPLYLKQVLSVLSSGLLS